MAARPEWLADIRTLLQDSAVHRKWADVDFRDWIETAVANEQALVWVDYDDAIIAFASYAFLSGDEHACMLAGPHLIAPENWRSGGHIWVIDFVAPYGHAKTCMRQLKAFAQLSGLTGRRVHWTRRKE